MKHHWKFDYKILLTVYEFRKVRRSGYEVFAERKKKKVEEKS